MGDEYQRGRRAGLEEAAATVRMLALALGTRAAAAAQSTGSYDDFHPGQEVAFERAQDMAEEVADDLERRADDDAIT